MLWRDHLEGWNFSPVTWLVSLLVCAVTTATALWVGLQYAQRLVDHRESTVARDVVAAIERIIATVEREGSLHVAPLAGRPCAEIGRPLHERESCSSARAAAVVANGVMYCSSARGEINVPLNWYFRRQQGRRATAAHRAGGAHAVPRAGGARAGAVPAQRHRALAAARFFLIDSTYLVDTLGHGEEFGAGTIALSVGEATMDQDGTYRATPTAIPRSTLARSAAYPLAVAVVASPAFSSELRHRYALFIGAIGLLLGLRWPWPAFWPWPRRSGCCSRPCGTACGAASSIWPTSRSWRCARARPSAWKAFLALAASALGHDPALVIYRNGGIDGGDRRHHALRPASGRGRR